MNGTVVFLAIAPAAGRPMQPLPLVMALPGLGLAGDRYALRTGFYSATPAPGGGRELTLIAAETLDALAAETGIALDMTETRRNVTTRGVSLEALIGRRFRIGEVVCAGVRPCDPCAYLEAVTGKPVLRPLTGRGGLRANILRGGTIRLGDAVEVEPNAD